MLVGQPQLRPLPRRDRRQLRRRYPVADLGLHRRSQPAVEYAV